VRIWAWPGGPATGSTGAWRRRRPAYLLLALVSVVSVIAASGCAHRARTTRPPAGAPAGQPASVPPPAPTGPPRSGERQPEVPEYVEEGVASWYGIPFNGRRTSNGEVYDMRAFTAAHRTLPFGAVVRVTSLTSGKHTEVRINDRGPFVADRIIDLSRAAAEAIEMIGTGTTRVRLEVVSGPNPQAGLFGVQVGAFLVERNAERLKQQLAARYSQVAVVALALPNGQFYRVRVGRLPSEFAARQLADQLHSREQLTTFVVRLDE
jgi:rare lipoprotein A